MLMVPSHVSSGKESSYYSKERWGSVTGTRNTASAHNKGFAAPTCRSLFRSESHYKEIKLSKDSSLNLLCPGGLEGGLRRATPTSVRTF